MQYPMAACPPAQAEPSPWLRYAAVVTAALGVWAFAGCVLHIPSSPPHMWTTSGLATKPRFPGLRTVPVVPLPAASHSMGPTMMEDVEGPAPDMPHTTSAAPPPHGTPALLASACMAIGAAVSFLAWAMASAVRRPRPLAGAIGPVPACGAGTPSRTGGPPRVRIGAGRQTASMAPLFTHYPLQPQVATPLRVHGRLALQCSAHRASSQAPPSMASQVHKHKQLVVPLRRAPKVCVPIVLLCLCPYPPPLLPLPPPQVSTGVPRSGLGFAEHKVPSDHHWGCPGSEGAAGADMRRPLVSLLLLCNRPVVPDSFGEGGGFGHQSKFVSLRSVSNSGPL